MRPYTPDEKHPAVRLISFPGGPTLVVPSNDEREYTLVPGTNVIIVGPPAVSDNLSQYLEASTNKVLREATGLQFDALAHLRRYLGIAGGSGHGGRRPGAGKPPRRRKQPSE